MLVELGYTYEHQSNVYTYSTFLVVPTNWYGHSFLKKVASLMQDQEDFHAVGWLLECRDLLSAAIHSGTASVGTFALVVVRVPAEDARAPRGWRSLTSNDAGDTPKIENTNVAGSNLRLTVAFWPSHNLHGRTQYQFRYCSDVGSSHDVGKRRRGRKQVISLGKN